MSRPSVRKTENVKTAPIIGVIGGVFGRLQGKGRGFPVGDGPQGAPAKLGPEAAPTAMRSMAGPAGRILAFYRPGNPTDPAKRACQS